VHASPDPAPSRPQSRLRELQHLQLARSDADAQLDNWKGLLAEQRQMSEASEELHKLLEGNVASHLLLDTLAQQQVELQEQLREVQALQQQMQALQPQVGAAALARTPGRRPACTALLALLASPAAPVTCKALCQHQR
jgi:hypothetical protein